MQTKNLSRAALALFPTALLALTSCSTSAPPPVETTSTAAFEHGVPGGVFVETHKMTANVTDVDAASRKITLLAADGKKTAVKCGPEVINFDQIHVGDQVKATVTDELVAAMAGPGAPSDGAASVVLLAPKGAKPGGIMAGTVQVTAKIAAIDLKHHKATLQFPDTTTKSVAVRPDVDLTLRKVGEEVVLRVTETVAISVEKP